MEGHILELSLRVGFVVGSWGLTVGSKLMGKYLQVWDSKLSGLSPSGF